MDLKIKVMIMSGVEDGTTIDYDTIRGDGKVSGDQWILSIGRREERDIYLRNDTYVSRRHANLIWDNGAWVLEDLDSTNGSFIESVDDFFNDTQVTGRMSLSERQLFRIGRTWLRVETIG